MSQNIISQAEAWARDCENLARACRPWGIQVERLEELAHFLREQEMRVQQLEKELAYHRLQVILGQP